MRLSKLYVADDDPVVRETLEGFGRSAGVPVQLFASGREFLEAYGPERPGCLVLAVRAPSGSDFAVLDLIKARHDPISVIALGPQSNVAVAVQALRAGALSFIEKPLVEDELVTAVASGLEQSAKQFEQDCQRATFERRLATLTPREREILSHLVLGKANKLIAYDLRISERTVEVHRYRLLRKMCVGSMVELARLAGAFHGAGERLGALGSQLAGQGEHHVLLGRYQLAHGIEAVLA